MKKIFNLLFATSLALGFVACTGDDDSSTPTASTTGNLTVDFTGLEELGDDFVYEGWVIVDGSPVSTGVFSSVDFPQTFQVEQSDLDAATMFVLSIEPTVDPDPAPAATKILSGAFSGDEALVDSTVQVADFSDASGKFLLATPTDVDTSTEYSGVWFIDNSSGSDVAGLDLDELAAGWAYEGWVVIDGTPISTGTFTMTNAADSNATEFPYTPFDSMMNPPFPGEDFVMGSVGEIDFPIDLRGNTVVVSVEPVPDNSAAPFTLKPLAYDIETEAMTHTSLTMGVGPVVGLSGTVTK